VKQQLSEDKNGEMSKLPLSIEHIRYADLVHQVERVGNRKLNRFDFLFRFAVYFLHFHLKFLLFITNGLISHLVLSLYVLESVFYVEHCGVVHV